MPPWAMLNSVWQFDKVIYAGKCRTHTPLLNFSHNCIRPEPLTKMLSLI